MVLVFAETFKGKFKKAAFEAVTYGYKTAQLLGTDCAALCLGTVENAGQLGQYGAGKVYTVAGTGSGDFDSQVYASVISAAAEKLGAKVVVLSHTSTGKALLGRIAARLNAGSVAGVNALPDISGGFRVTKSVYSGKAIAEYEVSSGVKVLSLAGNEMPPEVVGADVTPAPLDVPIPERKIKVLEVKRQEGIVPLPEAELVVSGGRGMKGPENWGIIEELAKVMGATMACSRPVADADWRPHHEHVGQTGIAIRPNLYVAIGISGAIQHLAGVNNSKVIVVINKDPEAPFFKAADYGVVADLFDVVPRLTESLRKFKAS
ncbi:MAG: electron transfer flavoprotein subunit alpha/FixB family protein [Saprospiraceae bacterium]|nr:MAG: electron transfer flavoprotein subunit alpha/FixB family protein [Saprospiraceae bacterium]